MLTQQPEVDGRSQNAHVGRMGEMYVYHRLMDLVRRSRQQQQRASNPSVVEFPTGHPLLGSGRVVRCHWCNADIESFRPFDLEVDVQGE